MPVLTPHVPDGLIDLMKALTKSVLKEKPENIYEFAVQHFERLIIERDGSLDKGYEIFRCEETHFKSIENYEYEKILKNSQRVTNSPNNEQSSQIDTNDLAEENDVQPSQSTSIQRKFKPRMLSSRKPSEGLISIKEEEDEEAAKAEIECEMRRREWAAFKIQRAFKLFQRNARKKEDKAGKRMTEEIAALIIQRSLKTIFSKRLKASKSSGKSNAEIPGGEEKLQEKTDQNEPFSDSLNNRSANAPLRQNSDDQHPSIAFGERCEEGDTKQELSKVDQNGHLREELNSASSKKEYEAIKSCETNENDSPAEVDLINNDILEDRTAKYQTENKIEVESQFQKESVEATKKEQEQEPTAETLNVDSTTEKANKESSRMDNEDSTTEKANIESYRMDNEENQNESADDTSLIQVNPAAEVESDDLSPLADETMKDDKKYESSSLENPIETITDISIEKETLANIIKKEKIEKLQIPSENVAPRSGEVFGDETNAEKNEKPSNLQEVELNANGLSKINEEKSVNFNSNPTGNHEEPPTAYQSHQETLPEQEKEIRGKSSKCNSDDTGKTAQIPESVLLEENLTIKDELPMNTALPIPAAELDHEATKSATIEQESLMELLQNQKIFIDEERKNAGFLYNNHSIKRSISEKDNAEVLSVCNNLSGGLSQERKDDTPASAKNDLPNSIDKPTSGVTPVAPEERLKLNEKTTQDTDELKNEQDRSAEGTAELLTKAVTGLLVAAAPTAAIIITKTNDEITDANEAKPSLIPIIDKNDDYNPGSSLEENISLLTTASLENTEKDTSRIHLLPKNEQLICSQNIDPETMSADGVDNLDEESQPSLPSSKESLLEDDTLGIQESDFLIKGNKTQKSGIQQDSNVNEFKGVKGTSDLHDEKFKEDTSSGHKSDDVCDEAKTDKEDSEDSKLKENVTDDEKLQDICNDQATMGINLETQNADIEKHAEINFKMDNTTDPTDQETKATAISTEEITESSIENNLSNVGILDEEKPKIEATSTISHRNKTQYNETKESNNITAGAKLKDDVTEAQNEQMNARQNNENPHNEEQIRKQDLAMQADDNQNDTKPENSDENNQEKLVGETDTVSHVEPSLSQEHLISERKDESEEIQTSIAEENIQSNQGITNSLNPSQKNEDNTGETCTASGNKSNQQENHLIDTVTSDTNKEAGDENIVAEEYEIDPSCNGEVSHKQISSMKESSDPNPKADQESLAQHLRDFKNNLKDKSAENLQNEKSQLNVDSLNGVPKTSDTAGIKGHESTSSSINTHSGITNSEAEKDIVGLENSHADSEKAQVRDSSSNKPERNTSSNDIEPEVNPPVISEERIHQESKEEKLTSPNPGYKTLASAESQDNLAGTLDCLEKPNEPLNKTMTGDKLDNDSTSELSVLTFEAGEEYIHQKSREEKLTAPNAGNPALASAESEDNLTETLDCLENRNETLNKTMTGENLDNDSTSELSVLIFEAGETKENDAGNPNLIDVTTGTGKYQESKAECQGKDSQFIHDTYETVELKAIEDKNDASIIGEQLVDAINNLEVMNRQQSEINEVPDLTACDTKKIDKSSEEISIIGKQKNGCTSEDNIKLDNKDQINDTTKEINNVLESKSDEVDMDTSNEEKDYISRNTFEVGQESIMEVTPEQSSILAGNTRKLSDGALKPYLEEKDDPTEKKVNVNVTKEAVIEPLVIKRTVISSNDQQFRNNLADDDNKPIKEIVESHDKKSSQADDSKDRSTTNEDKLNLNDEAQTKILENLVQSENLPKYLKSVELTSEEARLINSENETLTDVDKMFVEINTIDQNNTKVDEDKPEINCELSTPIEFVDADIIKDFEESVKNNVLTKTKKIPEKAYQESSDESVENAEQVDLTKMGKSTNSADVNCESNSVEIIQSKSEENLLNELGKTTKEIEVNKLSDNLESAGTNALKNEIESVSIVDVVEIAHNNSSTMSTETIESHDSDKILITEPNSKGNSPITITQKSPEFGSTTKIAGNTEIKTFCASDKLNETADSTGSPIMKTNSKELFELIDMKADPINELQEIAKLAETEKLVANVESVIIDEPIEDHRMDESVKLIQDSELLESKAIDNNSVLDSLKQHTKNHEGTSNNQTIETDVSRNKARTLNKSNEANESVKAGKFNGSGEPPGDFSHKSVISSELPEKERASADSISPQAIESNFKPSMSSASVESEELAEEDKMKTNSKPVELGKLDPVFQSNIGTQQEESKKSNWSNEVAENSLSTANGESVMKSEPTELKDGVSILVESVKTGNSMERIESSETQNIGESTESDDSTAKNLISESLELNSKINTTKSSVNMDELDKNDSLAENEDSPEFTELTHSTITADYPPQSTELEKGGRLSGNENTPKHENTCKSNETVLKSSESVNKNTTIDTLLTDHDSMVKVMKIAEKADPLEVDKSAEVSELHEIFKNDNLEKGISANADEATKSPDLTLGSVVLEPEHKVTESHETLGKDNLEKSMSVKAGKVNESPDLIVVSLALEPESEQEISEAVKTPQLTEADLSIAAVDELKLSESMQISNLTQQVEPSMVNESQESIGDEWSKNNEIGKEFDSILLGNFDEAVQVFAMDQINEADTIPEIKGDGSIFKPSPIILNESDKTHNSEMIYDPAKVGESSKTNSSSIKDHSAGNKEAVRESNSLHQPSTPPRDDSLLTFRTGSSDHGNQMTSAREEVDNHHFEQRHEIEKENTAKFDTATDSAGPSTLHSTQTKDKPSEESLSQDNTISSKSNVLTLLSSSSTVKQQDQVNANVKECLTGKILNTEDQYVDKDEFNIQIISEFTSSLDIPEETLGKTVNANKDEIETHPDIKSASSHSLNVENTISEANTVPLRSESLKFLEPTKPEEIFLHDLNQYDENGSQDRNTTDESSLKQTIHTVETSIRNNVSTHNGEKEDATDASVNKAEINVEREQIDDEVPQDHVANSGNAKNSLPKFSNSQSDNEVGHNNEETEGESVKPLKIPEKSTSTVEGSEYDAEIFGSKDISNEKNQRERRNSEIIKEESNDAQVLSAEDVDVKSLQIPMESAATAETSNFKADTNTAEKALESNKSGSTIATKTEVYETETELSISDNYSENFTQCSDAHKQPIIDLPEEVTENALEKEKNQIDNTALQNHKKLATLNSIETGNPKNVDTQKKSEPVADSNDLAIEDIGSSEKDPSQHDKHGILNRNPSGAEINLNGENIIQPSDKKEDTHADTLTVAGNGEKQTLTSSDDSSQNLNSQEKIEEVPATDNPELKESKILANASTVESPQYDEVLLDNIETSNTRSAHIADPKKPEEFSKEEIGEMIKQSIPKQFSEEPNSAVENETSKYILESSNSSDSNKEDSDSSAFPDTSKNIQLDRNTEVNNNNKHSEALSQNLSTVLNDDTFHDHILNVSSPQPNLTSDSDNLFESRPDGTAKNDTVEKGKRRMKRDTVILSQNNSENAEDDHNLNLALPPTSLTSEVHFHDSLLEDNATNDPVEKEKKGIKRETAVISQNGTDNTDEDQISDVASPQPILTSEVESLESPFEDKATNEAFGSGKAKLKRKTAFQPKNNFDNPMSLNDPKEASYRLRLDNSFEQKSDENENLSALNDDSIDPKIDEDQGSKSQVELSNDSEAEPNYLLSPEIISKLTETVSFDNKNYETSQNGLENSNHMTDEDPTIRTDEYYQKDFKDGDKERDPIEETQVKLTKEEIDQVSPKRSHFSGDKKEFSHGIDENYLGTYENTEKQGSFASVTILVTNENPTYSDESPGEFRKSDSKGGELTQGNAEQEEMKIFDQLKVIKQRQTSDEINNAENPEPAELQSFAINDESNSSDVCKTPLNDEAAISTNPETASKHVVEDKMTDMPGAPRIKEEEQKTAKDDIGIIVKPIESTIIQNINSSPIILNEKILDKKSHKIDEPKIPDKESHETDIDTTENKLSTIHDNNSLNRISPSDTYDGPQCFEISELNSKKTPYEVHSADHDSGSPSTDFVSSDENVANETVRPPQVSSTSNEDHLADTISLVDDEMLGSMTIPESGNLINETRPKQTKDNQLTEGQVASILNVSPSGDLPASIDQAAYAVNHKPELQEIPKEQNKDTYESTSIVKEPDLSAQSNSVEILKKNDDQTVEQETKQPLSTEAKPKSYDTQQLGDQVTSVVIMSPSEDVPASIDEVPLAADSKSNQLVEFTEFADVDQKKDTNELHNSIKKFDLGYNQDTIQVSSKNDHQTVESETEPSISSESNDSHQVTSIVNMLHSEDLPKSIDQTVFPEVSKPEPLETVKELSNPGHKKAINESPISMKESGLIDNLDSAEISTAHVEKIVEAEAEQPFYSKAKPEEMLNEPSTSMSVQAGGRIEANHTDEASPLFEQTDVGTTNTIGVATDNTALPESPRKLKHNSTTDTNQKQKAKSDNDDPKRFDENKNVSTDNIQGKNMVSPFHSFVDTELSPADCPGEPFLVERVQGKMLLDDSSMSQNKVQVEQLQSDQPSNEIKSAEQGRPKSKTESNSSFPVEFESTMNGKHTDEISFGQENEDRNNLIQNKNIKLIKNFTNEENADQNEKSPNGGVAQETYQQPANHPKGLSFPNKAPSVSMDTDKNDGDIVSNTAGKTAAITKAERYSVSPINAASIGDHAKNNEEHKEKPFISKLPTVNKQDEKDMVKPPCNGKLDSENERPLETVFPILCTSQVEVDHFLVELNSSKLSELPINTKESFDSLQKCSEDKSKDGGINEDTLSPEYKENTANDSKNSLLSEEAETHEPGSILSSNDLQDTNDNTSIHDSLRDRYNKWMMLQQIHLVKTDNERKQNIVLADMDWQAVDHSYDQYTDDSLTFADESLKTDSQFYDSLTEQPVTSDQNAVPNSADHVSRRSTAPCVDDIPDHSEPFGEKQSNIVTADKGASNDGPKNNDGILLTSEIYPDSLEVSQGLTQDSLDGSIESTKEKVMQNKPVSAMELESQSRTNLISKVEDNLSRNQEVNHSIWKDIETGEPIFEYPIKSNVNSLDELELIGNSSTESNSDKKYNNEENVLKDPFQETNEEQISNITTFNSQINQNFNDDNVLSVIEAEKTDSKKYTENAGNAELTKLDPIPSQQSDIQISEIQSKSETYVLNTVSAAINLPIQSLLNQKTNDEQDNSNANQSSSPLEDEPQQQDVQTKEVQDTSKKPAYAITKQKSMNELPAVLNKAAETIQKALRNYTDNKPNKLKPSDNEEEEKAERETSVSIVETNNGLSKPSDTKGIWYVGDDPIIPTIINENETISVDTKNEDVSDIDNLTEYDTDHVPKPFGKSCIEQSLEPLEISSANCSTQHLSIEENNTQDASEKPKESDTPAEKEQKPSSTSKTTNISDPKIEPVALKQVDLNSKSSDNIEILNHQENQTNLKKKMKKSLSTPCAYSKNQTPKNKQQSGRPPKTEDRKMISSEDPVKLSSSIESVEQTPVHHKLMNDELKSNIPDTSKVLIDVVNTSDAGEDSDLKSERHLESVAKEIISSQDPDKLGNSNELIEQILNEDEQKTDGLVSEEQASVDVVDSLDAVVNLDDNKVKLVDDFDCKETTINNDQNEIACVSETSDPNSLLNESLKINGEKSDAIQKTDPRPEKEVTQETARHEKSNSISSVDVKEKNLLDVSLQKPDQKSGDTVDHTSLAIPDETDQVDTFDNTSPTQSDNKTNENHDQTLDVDAFDAGSKTSSAKSVNKSSEESPRTDVENMDISVYGEDSLEAMYYSLKKHELLLDKMHRKASVCKSASSEREKLSESSSDKTDENIDVKKNLDEHPFLMKEEKPSSEGEKLSLDEFKTDNINVTDTETSAESDAQTNDTTANGSTIEPPPVPREKKLSRNDSYQTACLSRPITSATISPRSRSTHDAENPIELSKQKNEEFLEQLHTDHSLDDSTRGDIRRNILAYSVSEADSDYCEPDERTNAIFNDFNISTAFGNTPSTDTDSTIVSAATKIQAGARGFLTRRRLRRASVATTSFSDRRPSFGNDAIGESLEDLIDEEDAARRIQKSFRRYRNRKTRQSAPTLRNNIEEGNSSKSSSGSSEEGLVKIIDVKVEQKPQTPTYPAVDEPFENEVSKESDNGTDEPNKKGSKSTMIDQKEEESGISFDEVNLAARRMTLQRGDAVQRNSTAESDNSSISGGNGHKSVDGQSAKKSLQPRARSSGTERRGKNTERNNERAKRFTTRQRSMPVQIDFEILRVLPRHLRKRIRSADEENKQK